MKKLAKKQIGGDTKSKVVTRPQMVPVDPNKKSANWYKEGKFHQAYEDSSFKDDIDRNKKPYIKNADIKKGTVTIKKDTVTYKMGGNKKKK